MKTKILLAVAVLGVAGLSAQAGVRFGVSFALPLPLPVVAVAAPACPPPAVVTTAYVATPSCPGPDYAWVAGYWSVGTYGRVWVPGGWQHRVTPVVFAHFADGYTHDRDGGYRRDHGDDRGDYRHDGDRR
jgi:hypothetical protein